MEYMSNTNSTIISTTIGYNRILDFIDCTLYESELGKIPDSIVDYELTYIGELTMNTNEKGYIKYADEKHKESIIKVMNNICKLLNMQSDYPSGEIKPNNITSLVADYYKENISQVKYKEFIKNQAQYLLNDIVKFYNEKEGYTVINSIKILSYESPNEYNFSEDCFMVEIDIAELNSFKQEMKSYLENCNYKDKEKYYDCRELGRLIFNDEKYKPLAEYYYDFHDLVVDSHNYTGKWLIAQIMKPELPESVLLTVFNLWLMKNLDTDLYYPDEPTKALLELVNEARCNCDLLGDIDKTDNLYIAKLLAELYENNNLIKH